MEVKAKTSTAKITSNKKICPGHYLMELEEDAIAKSAVPGQFVNVLAAEGVTDPFLRIPLGIHRIKKSGIALFYKVVGTATKILSEKKESETVDILGPLGNGFNLEKAKQKGKRINILVAGGHGVAPLYALAEEILKRKEKVIVFIGASSKKCVTLSKEFRKMGCGVTIATDDGSAGKKGFVTCAVQEYLVKELNGEKPEIYACGPKPMLEALSRVLAGRGLRAQVSIDPYMACGTGVCRGCAVLTTSGYKLACKDGPVFYSDEIVWKQGKGCSL